MLLDSFRVLWFYEIKPNKLGGLELFSARLAELYPDISFTLCFQSEPVDAVIALLPSNATTAVVPVQHGFGLGATTDVLRLLARVRPDLVVYTLGGIIRPLPWLAALAGAEVVYVDQTSRTRIFQTEGLKGKVQRFLTRPVSKVIAVSEFTRLTALAENVFSCPAVTVPNGVDPSRLHKPGKAFRAKWGIDEHAIVVTQCSWLVPEKGVDLFIGAASLVRHPDVHFVIAGDGEQRVNYERLAAHLPITFTGQIVDPMAEGLYAASDIFCLPSRWQEACGFVNLEAMAFGVPIIASLVGGIAEYVTDGECGLLIEPTIADLAEKLNILLNDELRRQRLGMAGRLRAQALFTVDTMARNYGEALGLSRST